MTAPPKPIAPTPTPPPPPDVRAPGTLTKRLGAIWIVAISAVSFGAAAAVGLAVSGNGFDWTAAGGAGTAIGTVLLAGFTGALAWTTSGDVKATWELAKLTRQDQIARDRPLVVVEVSRYDPAGAGNSWIDFSGNTGVLHVELFNAGSGPALDILIRGKRDDGTVIEPRGVPALAPLARLPIALVTRPPSPLEDTGTDIYGFVIEGNCADRNGYGGYEVRYALLPVPAELA